VVAAGVLVACGSLQAQTSSPAASSAVVAAADQEDEPLQVGAGWAGAQGMSPGLTVIPPDLSRAKSRPARSQAGTISCSRRRSATSCPLSLRPPTPRGTRYSAGHCAKGQGYSDRARMDNGQIRRHRAKPAITNVKPANHEGHDPWLDYQGE